jgi:C4-dicarboxylate-binding protein DctP
MKRSKNLWVFVGFLLLGFILAPVTQALAKEYVIKFAHVTGLKSVKGQTGELFKKLVAERLKGKVKVQHFHSGQLYSDATKAIRACELNAVQMVAPATAKYTGEFPKLQVFDLPFIFSSEPMMKEAMEAPEIGGKLFAELGEKDLKVVGLWASGFRHFFNRVRPIKVMSDFKGLKFRIQASKAFEEFYKVVGANPIVMPFSEVYQALQQGIIDGEDQHWDSFGSSKHWEVAKYVTQCNYTYTGYLVAMNQKFWDSLPPDVQKELDQILKEVQAWNWEEAGKRVNHFVELGRKAGMKIYDLPPAELDRWKKTSAPVIKMYEPIVGQDVMQALYQLAEKYKK